MDLPDLTSDCANCAGLCCVGLSFQKGDDFAIDKASGTPCPNLDRTHRCKIHTTLHKDGFEGCIKFDCAGAGQRVTQMRFNGESWQDSPELLFAMMRDFENLRPLHERMIQLKEAGLNTLSEPLETERLALIARSARVWADSDTLKARYDRFLTDLAQTASS
ncbi:hypothetical protein [Pacificibacter marinus]|uniref:Uncharacterized protein n=1 Tax=Pacificibacter marinus TaxID=658057 RepID=A0A1Y5RKA4_9RHOB|nr:hypothetical protein [Pacificibacter marinus]SEK17850.1 hypothetical protein SAMN04488032_10195 [Pacificibacter marinus]SLN19588.1 hypothetical protein PAM7971_00555 [Pacificibacter marinus]